MDLDIQVLKNRQETEPRLWERNEWVERVGVVMSSRLFVTSSPLPNSERCLIVDVINCPIGPHNPLQFPGLVGSLNQWASRDLRQLFALQRSKEPVRTVSIEDAANPIKMIQLKFHICHCDKQSDLIWFLSQLSCQTLHIACHHNENSLEMKWHFHMGNLFWFPNSSKFWKSDVVFFVLDTINRNRWAKFIWFQVLRKFSLTCAINLQRHALCGFPIELTTEQHWAQLHFPVKVWIMHFFNVAFFQSQIFKSGLAQVSNGANGCGEMWRKICLVSQKWTDIFSVTKSIFCLAHWKIGDHWNFFIHILHCWEKVEPHWTTWDWNLVQTDNSKSEQFSWIQVCEHRHIWFDIVDWMWASFENFQISQCYEWVQDMQFGPHVNGLESSLVPTSKSPMFSLSDTSPQLWSSHSGPNYCLGPIAVRKPWTVGC